MRREKGPLLLLYQRLHVILLVTGAAVVGAWLVSTSLPPTYKAQAKGFVSQSPDRFTVFGEESQLPTGPPLPAGSVEYQNSLLGMFRSAEIRTRALPKVQHLGVDGAFLAKNTEFDIDKFNLLVVTAWHTRPRDAVEIATAFMEAFEEHLESMTRSKVGRDRDILEQKIAETVQELDAAEQARLDFMNARGSVDYSSEFEALATRIHNLRSEIDDLERREASIGRDIEEYRAAFEAREEWADSGRTTVRNPRWVELTNRLSTQQGELNVLLLKYTAEHPEVARKREQMKATLTELETAPEKVEGSFSEQPDPVRMRFEEKVLDLEIDQKTLPTIRALLQEQVDALVEEWGQMPTYKVQLDRLQQEISTRKATLEKLREGREEMRLFEARNPTYLEVTEQAIEPSRPSYPNVPMNMLVAGILGLVVGISLVALMERMRRIRDELLW